MKTFKTFVVEDHCLVRDGLCRLVEGHPALELVGSAHTVEEARKLFDEAKPQVVFLDLLIHNRSGFDLIAEWKRDVPHVKIIVLSMLPEDVYAERAIRAGAKAYVMKEEDTSVLLTAVDSVVKGEVYVSPKIVSRMLDNASNGTKAQKEGLEGLSNQELHAFTLIGSGLKTREVAEHMSLSIKTVETYRERIKNKLNLNDSAQLIQAATLWVNQQEFKVPS